MDTYKVLYQFDDEDVYGISIVDSPANQSNALALSEEVKKERIRLNSEVKKILTGIVLIPDQKIYREFEDGTPYLLTFEAQTIERISQDFLRKGYQRNSTYNHDDSNWLDGTSVVESWIVEDPENDKLNALGFKDIVKGTWAISMKLSDSLWEEYIVTGKAKGFSIDSFVRFEKIKNKIQMKKETLVKKIIKLFEEANPIKLIEAETSIGMVNTDSFEVGSIVYDMDSNPLVSSEFEMEGNKYVTDETGAITEITPVEQPEQEQPEQPEMETPEMETPEEEIEMTETPKEIVDEVDIVTSNIQEEVAKPLEEVDIEALKHKIEILTQQVEKLTQERDSVLSANEELKKKAASTKLKAEVSKVNPIVLNKMDKSSESALDVISRLTKKIN